MKSTKPFRSEKTYFSCYQKRTGKFKDIIHTAWVSTDNSLYVETDNPDVGVFENFYVFNNVKQINDWLTKKRFKKISLTGCTSLHCIEPLSISGLINHGNQCIPKGNFTVILDYPFENEYRFLLRNTTNLPIMKFLSKVADKYKQIYSNTKLMNELGVYGHKLKDLRIGKIKINYSKSTIKIDVFS